MKAIICFILWSVFAVSALAQTADKLIQKNKLSDYQEFSSYPFIDKAYQYEAQGKYTLALAEVKKAREYAPDYAPYQRFEINLTLALGKLNDSLSLILSSDNREPLLADWVERVLRSDDPEERFTLLSLLMDQDNIVTVDKGTYVEKFIDRFVGSNQYFYVIRAYEQNQTLLSNLINIKEKVMFAYVELGKIDAAQALYLTNQDSASNVMTDIFIELSLNGNNVDSFSRLSTLKNDKIAQKAVKAFIQKKIGERENEKAILGYVWLSDKRKLANDEKRQFLSLLIQQKDNKALAFVKTDPFSCSDQIAVFLQFRKEKEAADIFKTCLLSRKKVNDWQTYANRLLSANEARAIASQRTSLADELNAIALSKDIAAKRYTAIINSINVQSANDRELTALVTVHAELEQWGNASLAAKKLYEQSSTAENLEKLTYILIQAKELDAAKTLLINAALHRQPMLDTSKTSLLTLLEPNDLVANTALLSEIKSWGNLQELAELFRLADKCDEAVPLLLSMDAPLSKASLYSLGLCYESKNNLNLALDAFSQLDNIESTSDSINSIINVLVKQGRTSELEQFIKSKGLENEPSLKATLAQLYFDNKSFTQALSLVNQIKDPKPTTQDVKIESLIALDSHELALDAAREQFKALGSFTAIRWLRQANIYRSLGRDSESISALQSALALEPSNQEAKLALAYALINIDPNESYAIFQELEQATSSLPAEVYEQMAYLAEEQGLYDDVQRYLTLSFQLKNWVEPLHSDDYWRLRRLYSNTAEHLKVTLSSTYGTGAILGDVFFVNEDGSVNDNLPTNAVAARVEYFFTSVNDGFSIYGQIIGNGSDSDFFSQTTQEIGITYKPLQNNNFRFSTGVQKFLNGDNGWEGFVRGTGDALNKNEWRRDWRAQENWWERTLFYDFFYLYESNQAFGLVQYDHGFVQNISDTYFQTLRYYGLARYDYRKSEIAFDGQHSFSEFALGAGLRFEHYFVESELDSRLDKISASLEYRVNVSGDLSQDSQGLFVILSYEF
jgi:hypothetical protein